MSFVHLHVHSQYSILDSSASIADLCHAAFELEMPALAITDQGNLFGAVEFYKGCRKRHLRPILGCEFNVAPQSRFEKKRVPGHAFGYQVVFLAKTMEGYRNLCKLSSRAYLEGFYYTPRIDKRLIEAHSEGLICLSGGLRGLVPTLICQGKEEELTAELDWFQEIFKDDYYFEVQRHKMDEAAIQEDGMERESWLIQNYRDMVERQETVIQAFKELSQKRNIPLVATNDIRYIHGSDWRAQEILMNIQSGEPVEVWEKDSFGNLKERTLNPKRKALSSHELYFKSAAQMGELFSDMPEALANTVKISEACDVTLDFKKKYYPVFVPPHLEGQPFEENERVHAAEQFLKDLCAKGIEERYTPERLKEVEKKYPGQDPLQVVHERLEHELEIITSKGMCDYLLIVRDFIAWAKSHGIPVGPGRGSGAGSIILYLIGITDIEPLRFNLFFERFINPERISYPDIDVDICMDRRAEVIDYTVTKYGKEKVAQIITFGTMKAKMAIKDVGRVLSIPLSKVNAIAKLVPDDLGITLKKALEIDHDFKNEYDTDPEVKRWIDLAITLEGSVRNTGVHAAGLIVSGDPLMERIPICNAKDTDFALTQFSMKPVESVGMLKIDFLGLKTLTSIQNTVKAIKERYGKEIDWVNLPLDDQATFDLLNHGKTLGIFQVESGGMQELLKQLRIDKFEEIIAVGALYRPGPMEMIPSFISRKHGEEPIEFDHPLMKDILAETYGIMVYQEQVMQIASLLAGYSLGEGDVLRKAMGKKDKEEMSRQREKFREGAQGKGIGPDVSMQIFDKVEKFASYGFNKAHATAYGYLTYVTAYLKANYPSEWMAALMTSDREDITKVAKIIRECQAMQIAILPPDVNESGKEFVATPKGIRFALTAIKGVGEGVVEAIIEERKKKGHFASLYDFFQRVDTKKVGKKVVEVLIEAGCFDFTNWSRQQLVMCVDTMHQRASSQQREEEKGVMNLFSLLAEEKEDPFPTPPEIEEEIPLAQILRRENELLGFYLTGHPMDAYKKHLQRLSCVPFSHFESLSHGSVVRCAGIIEGAAVRISAKTQKKFAILMVGDGLDRYEVPVWPDLYAEHTELLAENQLIYAVLQLEKQDGSLKLQCRWIDDLTKVDEKMIEACDDAYNKAKALVRNLERREKKVKSQPAAKPEKEIQEKLVLHIDADAVQLSQILELKTNFLAAPGSSHISLQFYSGQTKVGEIAIQDPWGVKLEAALEAKLKKIPSILKMDREVQV